MLHLWFALLMADRAPPPSPPAGEPAIVTAFMTLCRPSIRSTAEMLADAASQGWQGAGTDRTLVTANASLTLHVADQENHGERLQNCGIRTTASIPTLAGATRAKLGFAPTLDLGTSATFFAIGDAGGWRSGAGLDHAQFLAAKAQGRFYSIVVGTSESGSMLYETHTIPPVH